MKIAKLFWLFALLLSFVACKEETDESQDEYANWKARNEAYLTTIAAKAEADPSNWRKLCTYSKEAAVADDIGDYIYAEVLESGIGTESPTGSDSVRVSYIGRLMPTDKHPQGLVFDTSVNTSNGGVFDFRTNATREFYMSTLTDGFLTALLYMHRGDHWRIYVPYQLGYGSTVSGQIPAYSVLTFEMALHDFAPAGEALKPWS